jgi:phage recombination protein Bet
MSTQVPANKADTHVFAYNGMRGEDIKFTLSQLRQMLPGVSKATDAEFSSLMEMCIAHKLNPYLREAYLVKYSATEPAQMVVGKETFTQRAEMNPDFDGYKAGIIVNRDGNVIMEEGSFLMPGEELLGGWFEGHRKNQSVPLLHKVSLKEYSSGRSTWKTLPATMIRKVALCQGLRELFPNMYAGLYDQAEMGQKDEAFEEELQTPPHQLTGNTTATTERSVPMPKNAPKMTHVSESNVSFWGLEWTHAEKFDSWSSRRDDGSYIRFGNWLKELVLDRKGFDDIQVNQDLKSQFGVTASKLSPSQAEVYLASLGITYDQGAEPEEADDYEMDEWTE